MRSDNGGKFRSHDFDDFCRDAGIKRELTVPYNPQQNGVAERKNRSICEAAKAMMSDLDLPSSLWVEAASTTIYVHNRSSQVALGDKPPKEDFIDEKSEVGHLTIFGCLIYIHVSKKKRMKMEPSGKKGTFVGYSEIANAYRIYVPGQRYIEVSRDVMFDEKEAF